MAKLSGKVYYHRLDEWQKKGYIRRTANGIFVFADDPLVEMHLYYRAKQDLRAILCVPGICFFLLRIHS
ncbi:MAG: hypothetical protein LWX56_09190 [Ignavibacteria bacterium]|nr:hypothetical protein [Ignavibacteria bacterium]